MKQKHVWYLCIAFFAMYQGCKPDQIGFLNDNLRYGVSTLQVVQGTATSTNPIIANGSSTPMTVELVEIRNRATGAVVPDFLVPQEFNVYLGQVGEDVTTLEQLSQRIGKKTAPAISINGLGGAAVISPATEGIPAGLYTVDLKATNIAGSKLYKEALDINLIKMKPDSVFAASATTTAVGSESNAVNLRNQDFTVSIEHKESAENKIIYMWLDKDGKPFNPKKGEIMRRATLPSFADWSPFYAAEMTDTAIVHPYPYYKGIVYPVKTVTRVGTTNYTDFASYYRVVADYTDLGRNINTATTARFYKPGTHIVRFKLKTVKHTGPKITTITKDVVLPEGAGYAATRVAMDRAMVEQALGMSSAEIASRLGTSITFYAIQADGSRDSRSTAAAPGQWLDKDGNTISWGDGARLFSEFKMADMAFDIGQFPDRNFAGDKFVIRQSLLYDSGSGIVEVVFVFNVRVQ
ncbi:DUF4859 domain-containing protein [Sphingobacterium psychroaquaticum]|uniref:DUF4859 domain-containing protein n=1 Tax=Sphingobacterium psychroaquaticum TaxID=561061 RepID=A0A1X7I5Z9_9SPHI|nr:DUF4859 domain-containing protein [Sphingobacterium psychroaquaticum]SMG09223.1 protein of unknown function [Sphingobacterium psychroaquaticum]